MRFHLLLAVLAIFAAVRCADAGVIMGESPAEKNLGACSAQMIADMKAAQQQEQERGNVDQGESSGMSGVAVSVSPSLSSSALLFDGLVALPKPTPLWVVTLANATLPPCPILDGLLKPS
ncbi:hypothetical protein [Novipirellula artificiosorum]|uniref:Uncharacterized protein n=1 Tax=Novipirellula artificiosorum TaxID=2528016 RepID=A0A5C6DSP7_9BACT|nr:hypothetical protein [Novipirellula artificiosorum]TWU39758.1 hypothetical protein Poly41_26140 [Novipirellula artificiosorum]